jgi:Ferritin-like domain
VERNIDVGQLRELMSQSQDLHSDAMKLGVRALDDYVDAAQQARVENSGRHRAPVTIGDRRRGFVVPAIIAGAAGAAVLGTARAAFAGATTDIQALQTAASLENLAVATYRTALTLPFVGGDAANPVVKKFATMTMAQHTEHGTAFNAAITKLGGRTQSNPDPRYAPVVTAAVPTIQGPGDVVGLAITLEDVAAQTYVKNVGIVSTAELRSLFASVAGVEAQHKSILLAVQALLTANAADLIALPPVLTKLPAAAGSVGIPDSFYPTDKASPVSEGAVQ